MDNKSRRSDEQKKMNRTIGTNIKFVRQCLGINQTKLANAIGPVRFQQVQKIEAAQNQINMQNAMNAFNLSSQSMSFLWQELRDQADFDFRAAENEENRKAQIIATAIANEGKSGELYDDYLTSLVSSLESSFRAGLYGG